MERAALDVPNPLLRQATTGGFVLSLGRTHIGALVYVDWMIGTRARSIQDELDAYRGGDPTALLRETPSGHPWSHLVPGLKGVIGRGLIEETPGWQQHKRRYPTERGGDYFRFPRYRYYRFTRAGRHARSLLWEAGVWQEYAAQLAEYHASEIRRVS